MASPWPLARGIWLAVRHPRAGSCYRAFLGLSTALSQPLQRVGCSQRPGHSALGFLRLSPPRPSNTLGQADAASEQKGREPGPAVGVLDG